MEGRRRTAMTLTRVVLPAPWRPSIVSSISLAQKRLRQAPRRDQDGPAPRRERGINWEAVGAGGGGWRDLRIQSSMSSTSLVSIVADGCEGCFPRGASFSHNHRRRVVACWMLLHRSDSEIDHRARRSWDPSERATTPSAATWSRTQLFVGSEAHSQPSAPAIGAVLPCGRDLRWLRRQRSGR